MEAPRLLCDSNMCRLCAEENKNSTCLFADDEGQQDLSQVVNKYLPLKVERDSKFPIVICPGCFIQLEATRQFLDLIIEGQNKLRELFRLQQETLRREEKQRQQLENALKNVNPNSSVETYAIQTDETGEKFIIQIFSDGPLFPPDHELSLKAEGLKRPKRKRGRPPKPPPPSEEELKAQQEEAKQKLEQDGEEEAEVDVDGRRRRKIKVPSRFQEAVQGKELDRIFKEEGVIDDDSLSEGEIQLQTAPSPKTSDEVIGHLQSKEGEDLGELVIINKSTNRLRIKTKEGSGVSTTKKRKFECDICGREFLHYGRYEVHKSFHKNVKYKCSESECNVEDKQKATIEEHQKESGHTGVTIFENLENYGQVELPQPNSIIENEEQFNEAVSNEISKIENEHPILSDPINNDNKFSCKICNKTFSCKQNYEVHCKAVHENQRPYQCDKCDKSFPYINSLKCHMLQHASKSEKLYACEICNKVFNHPSSLVYHREAEHNNGRRFVCNKCNKSFKHKQLLQRHQLVHSDERPHTCKMCNASFKTRANLLNHMPIHTGEKKYFCVQCEQAFAHKTSLTLHIRWHSGQKPYECDVCMKTFSQKGNLAEHKRIHTGEKPYCCDHCGRKFTTSSQFKLHIKRHTGERPWRCEYCSKTFLHKDTWKCHTRRHRNERPYQCQQCFRGFTEQWALKKHERLHTGEKPYICDICTKGFADCSNLTKHRKIHDNAKISKISPKPRNIKVISTTTEGSNQVLYLTYQDSTSNDSQLQTLVHLMDPMDAVTNETGTEALPDDAFLTSTGLPESYSQLQQVMDEDGGVLNITPLDGQQLKVVTLEEGNQTIQGLIANGTLVPLSLAVPDLKNMITEPEQGKSDSEKCIPSVNDDNSNPQTEPSNPTIETQLLENNIQLLNEGGNKLDNGIQFLTEDGHNICLVTTYSGDENINPQYLAMA